MTIVARNSITVSNINDGATGERGKQVFKTSYDYYEPNSSGHWWSDLSPTVSVSNPPKIGDTIINSSGSIFQITTVNAGDGGGGGTFGVGDVLGNIKGPNGKDGIGIKTTDITYAISTSGTTAPTTGWATSIPSLVKGQYFWTKTVLTYTDNSSKTGYSVTYISKDGINGNNGDPGKIVSDTEPTTKFKGLTWKYSGSADMTASDGTAILSGTEYYWSGTNWILNSINAHNINGNNLTITNGQFVSTTINGQISTSTEIKDNHIAISKTDGSLNTKNDIALDSEQGLAQKFTNIGTGFYRTAGINYQGPFTSDSNGNYAQLTPKGTKLSTDVPWTTLSTTNGFSGGSFQFSVVNGVEFFSIAGLNVPQMNAMQWYQATSLPSGSTAIPSVNRVYPISGNNNAWDLLINPAGGIFIRCQAAVSATSNLVNGGCGFPIG